MIPENSAKCRPEFFLISEAFGKQIANTFEDFVYRFESFVNSDELSSASCKIDVRRYAIENLVGQRLQPLLSSNQRSALLFRFERQVKIFQAPTGRRFANLGFQFIRKLALRINRL